MNEQMVRINPAVDISRHAEIYQREGRTQIPGIFEPELAKHFGELLRSSIPWSLTFLGPHKAPIKIQMGDLNEQNSQDVQQQIGDLIRRSGRDYGFLYFSFGMVSGHETHKDHPIHKLTNFLMGSEFAEFGKSITGDQSIRWADSQATLYRPNDFIGLHVDPSDNGVQRVAAYTLGFTSRWRSDWGGQLLFHDPQTGDITAGLIPRWNTLTVFKVPTLHSVAPVAPYAQGARLSVVGWFRSDE